MGLFLQEIIIYPLVAAVGFFISYLMSDRILSWLHKKTLGSREQILEKLEIMFVKTSAEKVTYTMIAISFGPGLMVFLLLLPNLTIGIILGAIFTFCGWQVPKLAVDFLFKNRSAQFTTQMVDGLTLMASGVKSGLTVPQSMEKVVENMTGPIRQEFGLVLSQIRLSLSLGEALNNLATRIPSKDVQMFVTAINILQETGGNMADTFSTIVDTIRERQKVQKKIEALTAQGMMQGIIITLVPFLLMGVFYALDPGYIEPMFTSTLGVVMLFVMLVLQIIGGISIKKIVTIKV